MSKFTKEIFNQIDEKSREYLLTLCRISRENNLDELALVETGLFRCQMLIDEYKQKEKEGENEQKSGNNDH